MPATAATVASTTPTSATIATTMPAHMAAVVRTMVMATLGRRRPSCSSTSAAVGAAGPSTWRTISTGRRAGGWSCMAPPSGSSGGAEQVEEAGAHAVLLAVGADGHGRGPAHQQRRGRAVGEVGQLPERAERGGQAGMVLAVKPAEVVDERLAPGDPCQPLRAGQATQDRDRVAARGDDQEAVGWGA